MPPISESVSEDSLGVDRKFGTLGHRRDQTTMIEMMKEQLKFVG